MGDERSRSPAAGASLRMNSEPETALEQGWLLAEMEEMLRLHARGTGAAFRPQRELGVAPAGVGGNTAGSDPAASARRQDRGADRDEVSGAGGAGQRWSIASGWRTSSRSITGHAASRADSTTPGARPAPAIRERILAEPELFLKTQQQQPAASKSNHAGKRSESDRRHRAACAGSRAKSRRRTAKPSASKIQHATRLLTAAAERIEEQRANHAEPSATHHDSGTARQGE